MKRWGIALLATAVAAAGITTYVVTRPEGNSFTDADADRAAQCLTRHPTTARANGYAQSCEGWDVIEDTTVADRLADLEATSRRMEIRIHHDELIAGFSHRAAITACYRMTFNYYGLTGGPDRIDCPK